MKTALFQQFQVVERRIYALDTVGNLWCSTPQLPGQEGLVESWVQLNMPGKTTDQRNAFEKLLELQEELRGVETDIKDHEAVQYHMSVEYNGRRPPEMQDKIDALHEERVVIIKKIGAQERHSEGS